MAAQQRERAAPFLYKTYDIVSDPENVSVCGWASDNRRARAGACVCSLRENA